MLLVKDYMTRDVVTMRPLDSARAARERFNEHRIQQVPIVVRGRLVGIVTDRDIRDAYPTAVVSHLGREVDEFADRIKLEALMTNNVITIAPDASMVEAAEVMRDRRIGALPVVEGERLIGILTRSDILAAFIDLDGIKKGERAAPKPRGR